MAWPFLCRVQQAQLEQPRPREVKGLAKGVRTWASYLHHNTCQESLLCLCLEVPLQSSPFLEFTGTSKHGRMASGLSPLPFAPGTPGAGGWECL